MPVVASIINWLEWQTFLLYRGLMRPQRKRRNKVAYSEFIKRVEQLGPDDIAIDFGANYGVLTEILAKTGATVHAFEPDPETFDELRKRTSNFPNVILHQAAVGAEEGEIKLYRGKEKDKWNKRRRFEAASIFSEGHDVNSKNYVKVPVRSIKTLLEELPEHIAIVKMDIEGAEIPVLEKLLESPLMTKLDAIFVETHEHIFPNLYKRTKVLKQRLASINAPYINLDWK